MARDEPVVNMHMPASLKRLLEIAAAREQRTLTKEIIVRLERSLLGDDVAAGVAEPPEDYAVSADAMSRLPADLRRAATRLLQAAAAGMPLGDDDLAPMRSNKAPGPRNAMPRRRKRPASGA